MSTASATSDAWAAASQMVIEEKSDLLYSLVIVHAPSRSDDPDAIHKTVLARSPLGEPVLLTDGRRVGQVVGLMQWPESFTVRKQRLPARSTVLAVRWDHPHLMELARDAEIAVARDGVFLVGDDMERTTKAASSGWGRRLTEGRTIQFR